MTDIPNDPFDTLQYPAGIGPSDPPLPWQPIETAPLDGTPVLVYLVGWAHPYLARWNPTVDFFGQVGAWVIVAPGDPANLVAFPALWQPLPATP